jgi:hypothetical protein
MFTLAITTILIISLFLPVFKCKRKRNDKTKLNEKHTKIKSQRNH